MSDIAVPPAAPAPAAPQKLPSGMTEAEYQSWYAREPQNAHQYAVGLGVDPVAYGCLPDGFTVASFEQFRAQNPVMAARWASDNRIYERGYRGRSPAPSAAPAAPMSDLEHQTRFDLDPRYRARHMTGRPIY